MRVLVESVYVVQGSRFTCPTFALGTGNARTNLPSAGCGLASRRFAFGSAVGARSTKFPLYRGGRFVFALHSSSPSQSLFVRAFFVVLSERHSVVCETARWAKDGRFLVYRCMVLSIKNSMRMFGMARPVEQGGRSITPVFKLTFFVLETYFE